MYTDTQIMFSLTPIPAFSDNYIWLLRGRDPAQVLVVDPGDAGPVFDVLKSNALRLSGILITHHHFDHTGGIEDLLRVFPVPVYGPDSSQIASISHRFGDGDKLLLGESEFEVLEIPGHTLDHIAWYSPTAADGRGLLLCGDTLFAAGCGRLFEGTAAMMWHSLSRLAALPGDTLVCCAHEYTLANLDFARTAEPDDSEIANRYSRERSKRDRNQPTLPSSIDLEIATNPFLHCHRPAMMQRMTCRSGKTINSPVEAFAELRHWKDNF